MKYRYRANLILTMVFVAFVITAVFKHFYGEILAIRLCYSVLEAALVGGIADWFAVTALFKRPLGISFHTELIPRNRQKVSEAVAAMVQNDLLSLDSIQQRIKEISFASLMVDYLEKNDLEDGLLRDLAKSLGRYADRLDPKWAGLELEKLLRRSLAQVDLSRQAGQLAKWFFASEEGDKWLDFGLIKAQALVRQTGVKDKLVGILEMQVKRETAGSFLKTLLADILEATDSLNIQEAAEALHKRLIELVDELREHGNPLRQKVKELLMGAVMELEQDVMLRVELAAWKEEVTAKLNLGEITVKLVSEAKIWAITPDGESDNQGDTPLARWIYTEVKKHWGNKKQDQGLKNIVDGYAREAICRIFQSEQDLIGNIVRETLDSLSDDDLNHFIEEKAGNDLQWIRINGSFIGGAVGLLLFMFLHYVYEPWVVPAVQGLLQ